MYKIYLKYRRGVNTVRPAEKTVQNLIETLQGRIYTPWPKNTQERKIKNEKQKNNGKNTKKQQRYYPNCTRSNYNCFINSSHSLSPNANSEIMA